MDSQRSLTQIIRDSYSKLLLEAEGKSVIYVEHPHVHLIRINKIRTDNVGVFLNITCLPHPGFKPPTWALGTTGEIGSAWDCFTANADRWTARYCWKLCPEPSDVEAVLALASEMAARGETMDDSQAIRCINANYSERRRKQRLAEGLDPDVILFPRPSRNDPEPGT